MKNQTFTTRRGGNSAMSSSWTRNRNTVHYGGKSFGLASRIVTVAALVIIAGLIYITQGNKATNYDYDLSRIDKEITELTAKKEDLAVEKARLTSIAASESSSVAMAMEDATISGYAEE